MGAFAPSPLVDAALDARIMREVIEPVMHGMRAEGHEYRGFLYAGLMITRDGPKVIEFNVRFGDPEAQVVMPSIAGSLAQALAAAADGALPGRPLALTADKHVGVVLASGDYPRAGSNGLPIAGLDDAAARDRVLVFHAGTASGAGGQVVTAGGRVAHRGRPRFVVRRRHRARLRRRPRASRSTACSTAATSAGKRSPLSTHRQAAMSHVSVLILMGSDSDAPVMQAAVDVLREFDIPCEMTVASAHRSPERVMRLVAEAPGRGVKLFIVGAGAAAHLGGVVAAHTTLPVIGVPIDSSALKGLDALLSTVQMPPGVPVATVSIGKPGATNAGVLAAQILAVGDQAMAARLEAYKKKLADKVEQAAARISA